MNHHNHVAQAVNLFGLWLDKLKERDLLAWLQEWVYDEFDAAHYCDGGGDA